jgi:hypothetical protein
MGNQASTEQSSGKGFAWMIGLWWFKPRVKTALREELFREELIALREIAQRHSALVKELFTDCYWGLLGNYRDLNRLARSVRTLDGFPSRHIEDIELCKIKIGMVIELTLNQGFDHLRMHGLPSQTIDELEKARQAGLKAWADRYADSDY